MKNFKTQTINIDSIYSQLQSHMAKRSNNQNRQDNLWKEIKKTNSNRKSEMERIDRNIGKETHEINMIISSLCQYKKTHKAMNLASKLLDGEIRRTKAIISKWKGIVREVEEGMCELINSTGVTHSNTTNAKKYIVQKQQRLAKLVEWKQHVDRYRV